MGRRKEDRYDSNAWACVSRAVLLCPHLKHASRRGKDDRPPKLMARREAERQTMITYSTYAALAIAALGVIGALLGQPGSVLALSTEAPATNLRTAVAGVPPWVIHCRDPSLGGNGKSDILAAGTAIVRAPPALPFPGRCDNAEHVVLS
jgi:hypothetical protein